MRTKIESLLAATLLTNTGKNSVVTFVAITVNTVFSGLFIIILARYLGPARLGLFSVGLALMLTVTGFADWGTGYGILRFVAQNKNAARSYLKLGLLTKLIFGLLGVIVVAFSGPWLASNIVHQPGLGGLFAVASLGVLGGLLYSFGLVSLQALEKFVPWGGVQIGWSATRVTILVLLITSGSLNPQTALLAYIVGLFFVFFGAIPFLPKGFTKAKIDRDQLNAFFGYNKWMAIYTVLLTIIANADRFFLARFSAPAQIGFYVAAVQIAAIGVQVQTALGTVIIPRFASLGSYSPILDYLKKTVLLTWTLAVGGVVIGLFAKPMVNIIFGDAYQASVVPLQILIISSACLLASLPFTSIWLYALGRAKSFALFFIMDTFLLLYLNFLLDPHLGAVGSALAALSSNFLLLFTSVVYVRLKLAKALAE